MLQQFSTSARQSFLSRIDRKGQDDCWNWIGASPDERGAVSIRIDEKKVSRLKPFKLAFEVLRHEIPEEYELVQTCGNPLCCNPAHTKLKSLSIDAFWEKIDKSPGLGPKGTCWEWRGGLTEYGYGNFAQSRKVIKDPKKRNIAAHIYSYRISKGEVPKGLCVCHECDNRLCVNPDHLWLGTLQDNIADREAKGRGNPGIVLGESNGSAKLTTDQVKQIKNLLEYGATYAELGRRFGVSAPIISRIHKGTLWGHVK